MSDWKNKQFYYVCPLVWQYTTNVDFLGAYWGYFYALASLGNNSGAQLILEWAWGTAEGLNWRLMVELETTKRQIHLAGSVGKSNLIPSLLAASPPTMASSRPAEVVINILISPFRKIP